MKASLRYWSKNLVELSGIVAAITVGYVFLTTVGFLGEASSLGQTFPMALSTVTCLALVICNYSFHLLAIPLQLAMGDTRRNCFWGFLYCRAVVLALVDLVIVVWMAAFGQLGQAASVMLMPVAVSAAGSLSGVLSARWKVLGIIVIVLACGGFGGLVGLMASMDSGSEALLALIDALGGLTGAMAVGTVVLTALDLGLHWLFLRKQAVSF